MTLQDDDFFFLFSVSSWGNHLRSFLTFPICFKCLMAIEWSTLSSLATSCVVLRGSDSVIAAISSLSTSDGQLHTTHLQGSRLFIKLLEPPLPCTFVGSSWAKCVVDFERCLCCFMTNFELEKIAWISFLSNSISIVYNKYKMNSKVMSLAKKHKVRNTH